MHYLQSFKCHLHRSLYLKHEHSIGKTEPENIDVVYQPFWQRHYFTLCEKNSWYTMFWLVALWKISVVITSLKTPIYPFRDDMLFVILTLAAFVNRHFYGVSRFPGVSTSSLLMMKRAATFKEGFIISPRDPTERQIVNIERQFPIKIEAVICCSLTEYQHWADLNEEYLRPNWVMVTSRNSRQVIWPTWPIGKFLTINPKDLE